MTLVVEKTPIEGLLVIRPKVFRDPRGFFTESYNRASYQAAGIATDFVQDNHSRSCQGTLRGLHYQTKPGQVKLVRCTLGKVWDVAVDIRPGSPTLGKHFGLELGPEEMAMLYIPIGFAHGFVALTEWADVQYKMSSVYDGATEAGIMWNDPDLSVPWPLNGIKPVLSDRDQKHPTFREYRLNL
jgi:dTDP-4-dehydrorhamnose 3,5-epimerase